MPPRTPQSITAEVDAVLGPAPVSFAQPEVVVLRFRRHGRRLVPPVAALITVAAVAGFWVGGLPEIWQNVLAGIGAAVLFLLLGLVPVLAWLARRTTVTTRRVIVQSGLLSRSRTELPLSRVREVRQRSSLLQRARGTGDIELLHGPEQLVLDDVPDCAGVADALQELMERNYEHATRAQQRLEQLTEALPGTSEGGSARSEFGHTSGGDPAAGADGTGRGRGVRFW